MRVRSLLERKRHLLGLHFAIYDVRNNLSAVFSPATSGISSVCCQPNIGSYRF